MSERHNEIDLRLQSWLDQDSDKRVDKSSEKLEKSIENAEAIVSKKWFRLYWVLFWALCVLLIESFFKSGVALGTVIWFVSAEVVSISFARYSTGKLNNKALLLCIPIGLINLSHLLFYSVAIQLITFPAALALFALQLTYLSKPEINKLLELFELKDARNLLSAVFVNPFRFIQYPFKGLLKFTSANNKNILRQVLIGLALSIPIAGLFIVLFSGADQSFAAFVRSFSDNSRSNFGEISTSLVAGAIMCVFMSALLVGANSRELTPGAPMTVWEVNNVTLGTILAMVAIVVVSYVSIQFSHWFGNIPHDYYQMDDYSASARGGFFELVIASCFLFVLIAVVTIISEKRENELIPLIKAPLLLLCASNLIVLYSAVEKMLIYILRSGITSRRVLALWFISVIVTCMIGQVIKITRFSFRAFNFCCVGVIILVCALSFFDMDYYVARNHIYLAENHKIQNLEAQALSGLSYAAAKPIAEYKNRLETGESVFDTTIKQDRTEVLRVLSRELERHQWRIDYIAKKNPVMGFNFSLLNASHLYR